jgi:hypothetical protein
MADTTKPDPKLAKHTYVLQTTSWIGPHLKKEGDAVEMTEAEAQYYVPHVLQKKSDTRSASKPADPALAAKPAKADKG